MIYGSVCSGIEAVTQAVHPLGWSPAFFSEIEKFPSAVLAHHYGSNMPGEKPCANGVPNYGDMTKFEEWPDHGQQSAKPIDALFGGTPCQTFSVAGLRKGLDDARGNLMLTYAAILRRYRPRWMVWENVPGVLSSDRGRDFASLLGLLTGKRVTVPKKGWRTAGYVTHGTHGYGLAWRVLDAQFVRVDGFERALPQRRRRVFVVGYIGDWRRAAAVLFERESLFGNIAPRRRSRQAAAEITANGFRKGGFGDYKKGVGTLTASGGDLGGGSETIIAVQVASCLDASFGSKQGLENQHVNADCPLFVSEISETMTSNGDAHSGFRDEKGLVSVPYSIMPMNSGKDYKARETDVSQPLMAGGPVGGNQGGDFVACEVASTLTVGADQTWGRSCGEPVAYGYKVRRLTPTECERLQGFVDGFTQIPWRNKPPENCPDGPRYKAIGNSMATNVMRWLARRMEMVERIEVAV